MHALHHLLPILVCAFAVLPTVLRAQPLPEHTLRNGLPHTAARVAAGAELRVAYLGGSITAANGYRPQTTQWLRARFPRSTVAEIKAAVPGTGSTLGVFRLRREALAHRPNLLVVEFAVNDNGVPAQRVVRAMEGIVRQTLTADAATDIVFVYTLTESYVAALQRGELAPAMQAMERVAAHYGLPSVVMAKPVIDELAAGRMVVKGPKPTGGPDARGADVAVFSPDGTHPFGETGHRLYAESL